MTLPIELSGPAHFAKSGLETLSSHGAILARGLFPRAWMLELGQRVDQTFAIMSTQTEGNGLAAGEARLLELRAFQLPRLKDKDGAAQERLAAPIIPIAEQILDGEVKISPFSFVRRIEPEDEEGGLGLKLPFHQDKQILQTDLINVWAPFRDCGVTAPSLEIVAKRLAHLEKNDIHDRSFYGKVGAEIPADRVAELYGDALVAPTLEAGDAFIFLGTTIHRTHIAEGMTEPRNSFEMRLVRS